MKCELSVKKAKKNMPQSTNKLVQAIHTLCYGLRFLTLKIKFKKKKSDEQWQSFMRSAGICAKCLNHTAHIILIGLFCFSPIAEAKELPKETQMEIVIGECEECNVLEMAGIAQASQNRFNRYGKVWGIKSLETAKERIDRGMKNEKLIEKVSLALAIAEATPDLVGGADHWEAVGRYGEPKWSKNADITITFQFHAMFVGVT